MRAERNILSAKEESKTSHINQAYNQFVAKNDNNILAETLACQRKMKHVNQDFVDPYHLVLTVISIVTETPKQTWVNIFQCVGIDPLNRPTWNEWFDRIKPLL